ncbi:tRNA (N6-isopentenyl adenosine(37)-C2)-methylthiotransferase MiaB [Fundidesulfovibrio butyratiphilus]
MKFHIFTFGCQMNAADSDWLARSLTGLGWSEADESEARVYILNTCSVRDKPEQKVYSQLGRLARHLAREPEMFCAVGGCVAQQVGEGLWDRFPFVRLVYGADGVAQAPSALDRLAREPRLRLSLLDFTESYAERDPALPEGQVSPQAFVNIMQGCDNFCAYCIVPYVRGRQKSRASGAILAECRALVERGVKEITLLGQNVNSYGLDAGGDGVSFPELLRRVAAVPGVARLRFTTSHPKDLDPAVVAAFADLENLCPSLHLPVQSGSDAVLARMGRKYDTARYLSLVESLKRARPDIALTTDLIVGFPGETEADFRATLDLVRQVGFEGCFSFMYNDRPGVAAAKFTPKVPQEIKSWRLSELIALQNAQQRAALKSREGRTSRVLVEGPGTCVATGLAAWRGRDEAGRVVNFAAEGTYSPGDMVSVCVLQAKKHSLWGEALP